MNLKAEIIDKIDNTDVRLKIALALGVSEQAIIKNIKNLRKSKNRSDVLTKAAAMKVIKEATGLKEEDILEAENV